VDVQIHTFLTSALAGSEWSASCPCCFIPRRNSPRYPLDRSPGGPQSQTGRSEEKILDPTGTRTATPWLSISWPVAMPTMVSRLFIIKYPLKNVFQVPTFFNQFFYHTVWQKLPTDNQCATSPTTVKEKYRENAGISVVSKYIRPLA
jgi:hypothetical protein